MLPPTERGSVLQLVRLGLSCVMWKVDSLESDFSARIVRYSLTHPVALLPLAHSLCRPACIPGLYKYPQASLRRLL